METKVNTRTSDLAALDSGLEKCRKSLVFCLGNQRKRCLHRSKRVAVIGIKGMPSRASGVEVHAENLYQRMSSRYEITAFCRKRYCAKICSNYKGIRIKYIPSINTKSLDAISYTFVATIAALLKGYDIYHFHALGPSSMCWLPKLFRKKVICTVHGLDWKREKWGRLGRAYLQFGEKMLAKYADSVIVLTKADKEHFQKKWGITPTIISNGVNIPKKMEDIMPRKGLEDGYILFLARLVPEKGIHYLIEAYIASSCTKKLVIAGDGSHSDDYVERLHHMAERNRNIIFTGRVEGEELISLYQHASLYVLPSDLEGQPVGLLEAMSYGCLCLVSDIDANIETLGDYGYYFKKGDVKSLTDKLKEFQAGKLTVDKEKEKSYIEEKYGWDAITEKTIIEYGRLENI